MDTFNQSIEEDEYGTKKMVGARISKPDLNRPGRS